MLTNLYPSVVDATEKGSLFDMKIGKVPDQANGKNEKKKPLIQEINPDPVSVPAVNSGTYKPRKDRSLFSAV